jgi:single-stranded DNA-binding protein
MGRAISMTNASLIGVRVSSVPTYVPAYLVNGKKINQKITIPVVANDHRGNGGKGKAHSFRLVAWGKLADVCARSCSMGKALDVFASIQSYPGKVFNRQGNLKLDNTGQAIEVTKVSFTIEKITFGEESAKFIAGEVQNGLRPVNWNVPGHADYTTWQERLRKRQATTWNGKSEKFGFAKVFVPQNVQLDFSQPEQNNLQNQVQNAVNQQSMQSYAGDTGFGGEETVTQQTQQTQQAGDAPNIPADVDDLF